MPGTGPGAPFQFAENSVDEKEKKMAKMRAYQKARYDANPVLSLERCRQYRMANPERDRERKRLWRVANREYHAEYTRQWRLKNKHKTRLRRNVDLAFKAKVTLRKRLWEAVRAQVNRGLKDSANVGQRRPGSAIRSLGCSIPELLRHIEAQFKPGMTWGNWSLNGWHIDHMHPLSSFDLTDMEQLQAACHFTNLQPLWAKENLAKASSTNWGPNLLLSS